MSLLILNVAYTDVPLRSFKFHTGKLDWKYDSWNRTRSTALQWGHCVSRQFQPRCSPRDLQTNELHPFFDMDLWLKIQLPGRREWLLGGFLWTVMTQIISHLCYNSELFVLTFVVLTITLLQSNYEITLDDVSCRSAEWESCSFNTNHNCAHNRDVFLSCFSEDLGKKLTKFFNRIIDTKF